MRNSRLFWFLPFLVGVVLLAGGFYPTYVRHRFLRRSLIDAVKSDNYALTELLLRGADRGSGRGASEPPAAERPPVPIGLVGRLLRRASNSITIRRPFRSKSDSARPEKWVY